MQDKVPVLIGVCNIWMHSKYHVCYKLSSANFAEAIANCWRLCHGLHADMQHKLQLPFNVNRKTLCELVNMQLLTPHISPCMLLTTPSAGPAWARCRTTRGVAGISASAGQLLASTRSATALAALLFTSLQLPLATCLLVRPQTIHHTDAQKCSGRKFCPVSNERGVGWRASTGGKENAYVWTAVAAWSVCAYTSATLHAGLIVTQGRCIEAVPGGLPINRMVLNTELAHPRSANNTVHILLAVNTSCCN